MIFKFETYNIDYYALWNNFVLNAVNATFLFHRDFIEYHGNRFTDASVLIFKSDTLVAICPANKIKTEWHSHQGLTYGGIVVGNDFNPVDFYVLIKELSCFLKSRDCQSLLIKAIPQFYGNDVLLKLRHQLIKHQAQTYRSDMVLALDYSQPLNIHKTKLKHYRRNLESGFVISEEEDFSSFWNELLIPRLHNKHQAKPVHTLEEIQYLKSKFKNNIKQFNLFKNNELLAGITIFDTGTVVKSQYGATSEKGEKYRAIEFLFIHLIHHFKDSGRKFFSMGTVTEQNDLGYNPGLLKQKEELGCKLYHQDFLSLKLV